MVTIVFKNHTENLRVLTDKHGTGGKQGIAVPGRNHGDGCSEPVTLKSFQHCEQDIKTCLKYRYLELLARYNGEERRVSYDDALALLTPPKEAAPQGFPGAPPRAGETPAFIPPHNQPAPPGVKLEG